MEEKTRKNADISQIAKMAEKIAEQTSGRLIGYKEEVKLMLTGILSGGHVLIEGVPGLAKTLSVRLLSAIMDAGFSRIQFTPDLMPADVTGTMVYNQKSGDFSFHKGPVFSNFILIDEINRAPAKTQSALFEVMEEKQVTSGRQVFKLDEPFHVFATQNPIEHEGTYRLPEAQADRFLMKIHMGYPAYEEEVRLLESFASPQSAHDLKGVRPVISKDELKNARKVVESIHASDNVLRYVADLIRQTRNTPELSLGASPRSALSLLIASRAYAALEGRDYITPEDVQYLAIPVLSHRILLSPEEEMEGNDSETVLKNLIREVKVPR